MKILLTGGTGMVGQNILEYPNPGHQILAPGRSELDLTSRGAIADYLKKNQPDLVIHAAGKVGGIQANTRDKFGFLRDNLNIGTKLVESCFDAGIKKLLNLSSSCMYPKTFEGAIPEESILTGPLEPTNEGYAIAKIAVAKMCEYISSEKPGFFYKTLIPCNLYGRHDKFDPAQSHLIPAVIKKLHEAKLANAMSVEIWGDGLARREFMYTGDLVKHLFGCIEVFERLPQYLNLGLGYDYTINEYYEVAAKVIGYPGGFTHDLNKPVGMKRKLADSSRLHKNGDSI